MKSGRFLFFIFMLLIQPVPIFAANSINYDFNDSDLAQWEIIDQGTTSAPSLWEIENGVLSQKSNIYSSDYRGTMLVTGDLSWTEYKLSLELRSSDNDGLGVIFWYKDPQNYYRLRSMGTDNYKEGLVIEEIRDGKRLPLVSNTNFFTDDIWHSVEIILTSNSITLFYDKSPLPTLSCKIEDSQNSYGKIGLYSWGNQNSYFDNIRVEPPPGVLANLLSKLVIVPVDTPLDLPLSLTTFDSVSHNITIKTSQDVRILGKTFPLELAPQGKKEVILQLKITKKGSYTLLLQDEKKRTVLEIPLYATDKDIALRIPLFADLHMHTTYSDGKNTPLEMIIQSKKVGMDVIAITDHGTTQGADAGLFLVEKIPLRLKIIRAEENPGDFPSTHLLAYNIPQGITHIKTDGPEALVSTPEGLCQWAKDNNVLIFQAHPDWENHGGTTLSRLELTQFLLAGNHIVGYELANGSVTGSINTNVIAMYEEDLKKGVIVPILGSSDAHYTSNLGKVRTILFSKDFSTEAIIEAMKTGKTVVMDSSGSLLYGPEELVTIARLLLPSYLPAHDRLAYNEAETARLYWGGHVELKEDLETIQEKWKLLFDTYFPLIMKNISD